MSYPEAEREARLQYRVKLKRERLAAESAEERGQATANEQLFDRRIS